MKLLLAIGTLFLIGIAGSPANAQWDQELEYFVPLQDDRTVVEKKLGAGSGTCLCEYETERSRITVRFASSDCDDGWKVQPGTVISYTVFPKEPLSLAATKIDVSNFLLTIDDGSSNYFTNREQGLVVGTTTDREVEFFMRVPQLATGNSRCLDHPPYEPMNAVYPVAFRYDVTEWKRDISEINNIVFDFARVDNRRMYVFIYMNSRRNVQERNAYVDRVIKQIRSVVGSEAAERVYVKDGGHRSRESAEFYVLNEDLPPPVATPNPRD